MKTALEVFSDLTAPPAQRILAAARLLHDHHVLSPEVFAEIYGGRNIDTILKMASQTLWAHIETTTPRSCKWEDTASPAGSSRTSIPPRLSPPEPDFDGTHDRPHWEPPVRAGRSVAQVRQDYASKLRAIIESADPDAADFVPIPSDWGKSGYKFVGGRYGCWFAQFARPGHRFYKAGFSDPIEAQKAALRSARQYFGIDPKPGDRP